MKVGVVIPAYRETTILDTLQSLKQIFPTNTIYICPCDDRQTAEYAKEEGAIVPHRTKRIGYGKSLAEGLRLAYFTHNCDYIIEMDVDHPVQEAKKLFNKTVNSRLDVCIGHEDSEWKLARRVANGIVNFFFFKNQVTHPTCGLVCFSNKALQLMPWKHIKSKGDFIHIELLYWAYQHNLRIMEHEFSGHEGERNYGFRRVFSWLRNFFRLLRIKYLWFWRSFI